MAHKSVLETPVQEPQQDVQTYQDALLQDAKRLFDQQIAPGTRRVYQSDWQLFETWCQQQHGLAVQATPAMVALFLTSQYQAQFHPTTINRRLAAIKYWFLTHNLPSPTEDGRVRAIIKGIRRDKYAPPSQPKKALLKELITQMVDLCPTDTLRGIRDRAILLLGFCGGYRRSELVAIDVDDIHFQPGRGMDITLRRSKADQEGKGSLKPIAAAKQALTYCPVRAVKQWIAAAHLTSGALFRGITKDNNIKATRMNANVVYDVIKRCATTLGYEFHDYSPHSLRAGFITQALREGARQDKIPSVTLHKSMRSLDAYVKHEDRYEDHPGEKFF